MLNDIIASPTLSKRHLWHPRPLGPRWHPTREERKITRFREGESVKIIFWVRSCANFFLIPIAGDADALTGSDCDVSGILIESSSAFVWRWRRGPAKRISCGGIRSRQCAGHLETEAGSRRRRRRPPPLFWYREGK